MIISLQSPTKTENVYIHFLNNYNIHTFKELTVYCWLCWTEKQCSQFYFMYKTIHLNFILGRIYNVHYSVTHQLFDSALWLHHIICMSSISNMRLLDSVTETTHKKY